MAAKRDYYDVLGISRSADKGTIKRAYRKLAKKYHPDTNAGNAQAEEKFKEATEAYNVLSDPEKKKLYDQFGHAAFDGSAGGSGAYGYGSEPGGGTYSYNGPNGSFHEYHFEGGDMDDILKNIFGGGFSEGAGSGFHGFGGFGKGFSGGGNFRQDGSDVTAEIDVTFDEAAFGGDKVIRLSDAQGSNVAGKSLKVHIPAGISDGKSIRLRGKGMPGVSGGKAGDLLLKVRVGKRPGFERCIFKSHDSVYYGSAGRRSSGTDTYRKSGLQDQSGNAVRNEDPVKRQRNRVYEGCRKIWRSVCDCSDRCTKESQ